MKTAFETKVKQRISDIKTKKIEGTTEKYLDSYLKKRGIKLDN